MTQIADTLARQEAWAAAPPPAVTAGCRTGAYTYVTAVPRR